MEKIVDINASFELIPSESGKTWTVSRDFTVQTRYGPVTIRKGFVHDRYTVAPNLSDEKAAVVHDWLYIYKVFDNGKKCGRPQADHIFKDLILEVPEDAKWAGLYYFGVRAFGWLPWYGFVGHK